MKKFHLFLSSSFRCKWNTNDGTSNSIRFIITSTNVQNKVLTEHMTQFTNKLLRVLPTKYETITDVKNIVVVQLNTSVPVTTQLPQKLTHVGNNAFGETIIIQNITSLPLNLTHIGNNVFGGCKLLQLKDKLLPSTLIYIGDYAFQSCITIQLDNTKHMPPNLSFIGTSAFVGCDNIYFDKKSQNINMYDLKLGVPVNIISCNSENIDNVFANDYAHYVLKVN